MSGQRDLFASFDTCDELRKVVFRFVDIHCGGHTSSKTNLVKSGQANDEKADWRSALGTCDPFWD